MRKPVAGPGAWDEKRSHRVFLPFTVKVKEMPPSASGSPSTLATMRSLMRPSKGAPAGRGPSATTPASTGAGATDDDGGAGAESDEAGAGLASSAGTSAGEREHAVLRASAGT